MTYFAFPLHGQWDHGRPSVQYNPTDGYNPGGDDIPSLQNTNSA